MPTSSSNPFIDPKALMGASRQDLIKLASELAALEQRAGQVGPQTDDELHALIKDKFGINIPRVAVTQGHDAPFDFVSDAFFQRETSQLVVANREGSKTFSVAVVHALMARYYPGYEGLTAGAIEIQSKRAYSGLKSLNAKWGKDQIENSLQSETNWKNSSKVEIVTGCLPPYAKIITDEGEMKISTIVNQQLAVNVKSYNFATQEWEWKPVTGWHNNGKTDKWLRVKLDIGRQGKTHLCATSGHSVYQPDGSKKMLGEFRPGEIMCVPGEQLSDEQEQILLGKMLGDGHVNAKGVVCFDHGNDQLSYLQWQHDAFKEFASGWSERAAKGTTSFRLKCARRFHELRAEWYQQNVKRIPPEIWTRLDVLGLAIWLMDDGNWTPGSGGQWVIACHHFNVAERFMLAAYFSDLGVDGSWVCVDAEKDQWMWRTVGAGGQVLLGLVADHIDVSIKQRRGYKQWTSTTKIAPSTEALLPAVIESIEEHRATDRANQTRYDITVADNHNYCVGSGILISNTYAAMNGPHSNLLHRDEIELFRPDAYDEGDNITKSGWTNETPPRPIKAHDILTSTRKKARGKVQQVLDECEKAVAEGREPPYRVYKWGVAETVRRVPNCRGLPENADLPDGELCPCNTIVSEKSSHWDMDKKTKLRTLESVCDGRFGKSDGWRPLVPDIIGKFKKNSRAMWEAQQECMKVASEGLILGNFNKDTHGVYQYDPDPENGPIFQGIDFGGTNPHAINWYQELSRDVLADACDAEGQPTGEFKQLYAGDIVAFDEVYVTEIGNVALADLAVMKETEWRLTHNFFRISERYADIAAKSARLDWRSHNPPLPTVWRITREIDEHIILCQEIVDNFTFHVDVLRCPMFCEEAESWQTDPVTGNQIDEFNHAMSAFRYTIANLHRKNQARKKRGGGGVPAGSENKEPIESKRMNLNDAPDVGPSSRTLGDDPFGIPMHAGPSAGPTERMW